MLIGALSSICKIAFKLLVLKINLSHQYHNRYHVLEKTFKIKTLFFFLQISVKLFPRIK